MGECNDNPTVRQFSAAYKRILLHNDMQDIIWGNCIPFESLYILTTSSSSEMRTKMGNAAILEINSSLPKRRVLNSNQLEISSKTNDGNDDYIYIPSTRHLSLCSNAIVAYIAGFVVYKLKKYLKCETCIDALIGNDNSTIHSLVNLKNKGHLIHPSDDVIEICLSYEKLFRESSGQAEGSIADTALCKNNFQKIVISVAERFIRKKIFHKLQEHMFDTDPPHNHLLLLMKAVTEKYLQVRYTYAAKRFSAKILSQKKNK